MEVLCLVRISKRKQKFVEISSHKVKCKKMGLCLFLRKADDYMKKNCRKNCMEKIGYHYKLAFLNQVRKNL